MEKFAAMQADVRCCITVYFNHKRHLYSGKSAGERAALQTFPNYDKLNFEFQHLIN